MVRLGLVERFYCDIQEKLSERYCCPTNCELCGEILGDEDGPGEIFCPEDFNVGEGACVLKEEMVRIYESLEELEDLIVFLIS